MVVIVAAGDRLAHHTELRVVDILDRPFPGGPNLNPEWTSFWTLDEQRGGPATRTDDDVKSAEDGLEVIAAGRAIGTVPTWIADGLAHPGVIALPLRDGPHVRTRSSATPTTTTRPSTPSSTSPPPGRATAGEPVPGPNPRPHQRVRASAIAPCHPRPAEFDARPSPPSQALPLSRRCRCRQRFLAGSRPGRPSRQSRSDEHRCSLAPSSQFPESSASFD